MFSEVNVVRVTEVSLTLHLQFCLVRVSTKDLLMMETELPVSMKKLAGISSTSPRTMICFCCLVGCTGAEVSVQPSKNVPYSF